MARGIEVTAHIMMLGEVFSHRVQVVLLALVSDGLRVAHRQVQLRTCEEFLGRRDRGGGGRIAAPLALRVPLVHGELGWTCVAWCWELGAPVGLDLRRKHATGESSKGPSGRV